MKDEVGRRVKPHRRKRRSVVTPAVSAEIQSIWKQTTHPRRDGALLSRPLNSPPQNANVHFPIGAPLNIRLSPRVIGLGTMINIGAILLGGIAGAVMRGQMKGETQLSLQKGIAIATYLVSGILLWKGFSGVDGFLGLIKAFFIVFLSLILGNALGKGLRIQKLFTKLGRHAQERMNAAPKNGKQDFNDGFITCALLFCVSPMALFGALQEGVNGDYKILIIKAAVDGLSMMAFIRIFGWGSIFAVIPVAAYQGTLTLTGMWIANRIEPELIASITATNGMLVMCLPLIILQTGRKFPINDWIPALAVAPFITWLW